MSSHHDWPVRRITGILGILVFVGIAVTLGLTASLPSSPDGPIEDVRELLANDGGWVHASNWILAVTVVFLFLPFAAGLRSLLAKKDVDGGMWTRTAYGSAVGMAAVAMAGSIFVASTLLAFEPGSFDDAFLRMIAYADFYISSVVISFFIGLFLAATSIVVLRTGALWKWLGWIGLLIALIGLIGAWWPATGNLGALAFIGYLSIPLFAVWSLFAGINLLRKPAAASE